MMLRLAIIALSLGCGVLAAILFLNQVDIGGASAEVAEPVVAVPMQDVLVASLDLRNGDIISDAVLQWQSWPETAVNSSLVIREAQPDAQTDLAGRYVRGSFAAGEPIRLERLAETDARLLSASLPPGRRAVALRVSAESTAGGFVLPNDRVDVLLTATEDSDSGSKVASRVILRNIRVLAIDQLVESADADAIIGSTATLELSEPEVELVLSAAGTGLLSLALRSAADNHLFEPLPASEVAVSRVSAPAPAAPVAPTAAAAPAVEPAPEQPRRTILLRRGIEVETVSYQ